MSLYSNMQICGFISDIVIERRDGIVWVQIRDGNQQITMEEKHVRALWGELSSFEDAEARNAAADWPKEEVSPGVWVDVDPESIAKAKRIASTAVDAAETAGGV